MAEPIDRHGDGSDAGGNADGSEPSPHHAPSPADDGKAVPDAEESTAGAGSTDQLDTTDEFDPFAHALYLEATGDGPAMVPSVHAPTAEPMDLPDTETETESDPHAHALYLVEPTQDATDSTATSAEPASDDAVSERSQGGDSAAGSEADQISAQDAGEENHDPEQDSKDQLTAPADNSPAQEDGTSEADGEDDSPKAEDQPVPDSDHGPTEPAAAAPEESTTGAARVDQAPPDKPTYSLDTKVDADTTAREVLNRYDPTLAGLEPMSPEEAVEYIATHKDARPWLQPAADCDPAVQRVYATLDTGNGHAHQRHDGMGDSELYERRVTYLEDPAQLDPDKRSKSEDAFKPAMHYCDKKATRISTPEVFATAFARGLEDPRVQAALETPWQPHLSLKAVRIPIADLVGSDGHRHCGGFQLDGDWFTSKPERSAWVKARANGEDLEALKVPTCRPIDSFENGIIEFRFGDNRDKTRYEVITMFANDQQ